MLLAAIPHVRAERFEVLTVHQATVNSAPKSVNEAATSRAGIGLNRGL